MLARLAFIRDNPLHGWLLKVNVKKMAMARTAQVSQYPLDVRFILTIIYGRLLIPGQFPPFLKKFISHAESLVLR